jgi:DNA-binding transcriptional ArsR family regulator
MMREDDLIEALKALGHPLRWRILTMLATGERNVGEIEQATGIGQPGLSQQLGVLRKAGLVDTRKSAKLVYYSVADKQHAAVMAAIGALGRGMPEPASKPDPAEPRRASPGAANFARLW